MSAVSLSRRRVLLGMGALGAAGVCGLFSRAGLAQLALRGSQDTARLKLIFVVSPDGLGVDEFGVPGEWNGKGIWHPTSAFDIQKDFDTSEFTLGKASEVLADYRDRSLYLRGGISNFDPYGSQNAGHAGWQNVLRDAAGKGMSIDKLIADHFQADDPGKPLLYAGPHTRVSNKMYVSWRGPHTEELTNMLVPEADPSVLFEDVFGRASRSDAGGPRSAGIFDPVKQDIDDVRRQLRGTERAKFDTHLDAIEQVIKDINAGGGSVSCGAKPPAMAGIDISGVKDRTTVTKMHMSVVAASLACARRRVATVQISASTETLNIPDINSNRNPHDLAHWGLFGNGGESSRKEWEDCRRWYVERVKDLLDNLADYQDPDVPDDRLADHTLVIFTSEMADGYKEHRMDMPLLFIGGKHTPIHMPYTSGGRYLSVITQGEKEGFAGRPVRALGMQRVWTSLGKAIGVDVPYEGNTDVVTGLFTGVG